MKIGVNLSIDMNSIIDQRLIRHSNGKVYLNMTAFIDTENQGQYGDNGMITHAKNKDEQGQMQILGNCKVFWRDDSAPAQQQYGQQAPQQRAPQQSYGHQQPAPQQQSPNQQAPQQMGNAYQQQSQGGYAQSQPVNANVQQTAGSHSNQGTGGFEDDLPPF